MDLMCYMKGNETRMGKGKGTFEYWATRFVSSTSYRFRHLSELSSVPTGRVIFEIGGVPIREELARESVCPDLLSMVWSLLTRN